MSLHLVDDDGPFRDLTPEEMEESEQDELREIIRKEKLKLRAQAQARREVAEELAAADFREPDPDTYGTLAEINQKDLPPVEYLVGPAEEGQKGLLGAKQNAVLIAQFKTGKTALAMDLARCLVDGEPFLDRFPVVRSRVGFWSLEVELDELRREFMNPLGIDGEGRMAVWDGVGQPVNILSEPGKAWTIRWLKQYKVKVWMIDSLAVLAVWAGVNIDKDNDQTRRLFAAIDEIKRQARVKVSFILAHTPRSEMEEGKERARGASAIDEHAGARWIYTMEGEIRFLRINGRGVKLDQTSLMWDEETHRSMAGMAGSRGEVTGAEGVETIRAIVYKNPWQFNTKALLREAVGALPAGMKNQNVVSTLVKEAVLLGFIKTKPGKGKELLYGPLVEAGEGATIRNVAAGRRRRKP
ncbi:AAA family ATPase [Micromonospora sp. CA-246542]|uniref:AAA family ATPase n=1 Tax=Micromonospora sp. CA-246542 TaxID=3239959 RepID=UPI003D90F5EC